MKNEDRSENEITITEIDQRLSDLNDHMYSKLVNEPISLKGLELLLNILPAIVITDEIVNYLKQASISACIIFQEDVSKFDNRAETTLVVESIINNCYRFTELIMNKSNPNQIEMLLKPYLIEIFNSFFSFSKLKRTDFKSIEKDSFDLKLGDDTRLKPRVNVTTVTSRMFAFKVFSDHVGFKIGNINIAYLEDLMSMLFQGSPNNLMKTLKYQKDNNIDKVERDRIQKKMKDIFVNYHD